MKNKFLILALALMPLVFTNCKGDKGDTGTPGTNGNANVKSQLVTITSFDQTISGGVYNFSGSAQIDISQDDLNSAAVMVYENSNNQWMAMPYSRSVLTTNFEENYIECGYVYQTQYLNVNYRSKTDLSDLLIYMQYKVVIIPAGALKPVDLNNYEAVREAYNLN